MTLEEINKTKSYKLPFELISDDPSFKIIDCLFSNYEIPQSIADICDNVEISPVQAQSILDNLITEKIAKREKNIDGDSFLANFTSAKTMGLFQYYRAVLDENLENLTYNKINLK